MLWNLIGTIFTIVLFCTVGIHSKRVSARSNTDKVVVCYVGTWATYRPNEGQFQFGNGDLDPSQCTHLIYSFAGLSNETWSIKSLDPYLDLKENYGRDGYRNMTSLRQRYNGLKVTLAIGGWNDGSEKYSAFAANDHYRSRFVNSIVKFLKEYGFDGLDLDWEFPGKRGGNPDKDKDNFSLLVKELSMELKKKGMLLTTAISADKNTIDLAYNIPEISKYLDYIHVMAYDYHGAWNKKVLPNAPLHCTDNLCVEETVKHLLKRGAAADKLVLGLPLYGRTFVLSSVPSDQNQNPIGLSAAETGFAGPFTKEKGFLGYNEICKELIDKSKHWTSGWDENSKTPYAISGDQVIVYDNPKSIISKNGIRRRDGMEYRHR
ncbi:probable chitinase 2 isoform X2 [Belonocnema kinseyi]|uniref:probable chitinase 2 isoform X2 n=1 Tax=Belonocnema kinseyi TaxID=2817044 RepID=UPI00143E0E2A|nr:probable chitinase 2 isoform X2 [Belonocnema kinseyi]